MTAPRHDPAHERYAELVAGHALHALDESDERVVAEHLPQCAACQDMLAEFTETAAALAEGLHTSPPAGLEAAIFDNLEPDRAPASVHSHLSGHWRRWTPLAAAASVLLLVGGAVLVLRDGQGPPATNLASTETVLRCQQAPDCEAVLLTAADGAARAVVLLRADRTSVLVEGLEPSDPRRDIYVLWQQAAGGGMQALATFDISPSGQVGSTRMLTQPRPGVLLAISHEVGRSAPPAPSLALLSSGT